MHQHQTAAPVNFNLQAPLPVPTNQNSQSTGQTQSPAILSTISGTQELKVAPPPKQLLQEGTAPVSQKSSIILQPPMNLLNQAASPILVSINNNIHK